MAHYIAHGVARQPSWYGDCKEPLADERGTSASGADTIGCISRCLHREHCRYALFRATLCTLHSNGTCNISSSPAASDGRLFDLWSTDVAQRAIRKRRTTCHSATDVPQTIVGAARDTNGTQRSGRHSGGLRGGLRVAIATLVYGHAHEGAHDMHI